MPTKATKERPDDAAPAVVEAAGDRVLSVEFNKVTYTFKAKRLDSVQFRSLMQKDRVVPAVEHLLGPVQWASFLAGNADADGDTPLTVFYELVEEIGEVVGSGNS